MSNENTTTLEPPAIPPLAPAHGSAAHGSSGSGRSGTWNPTKNKDGWPHSKKTMNSREKGKRGERMWRDELRAQGYDARRGQQFAGGGDSPDVVSELPFHFEVKFVENLNLRDAMEQAARDAAPGKPPVVAHKRSNSPWLVTMRAEDWFALVREVFPKT